MRTSPVSSRTSIVGAFALISAVQAQSVSGATFYNGSGSVGAASYQLVDSYDPTNGFFDKFNFYSGMDPGTYGHVYYVNETVAEANGFVSITSNNTAKIIPDHTNVWPRGGAGRPSVRIISDNTYTHGLFIADFKHMPWGCGTWPAYWLLGPNWPYNGEIDIIEGVNTIETDAVTLHTGPNCSIAGSGQLGTNDATDCNSANGGNGCGSTLSNTTIPDNYGNEFNSAEGGVYATEWTSSYIKTWFFRRGSIPSDITSGSPVPGSSAWGTPAVNAQGSCNIDNAFHNMSIIINIDFCGAWAGEVYESEYPNCPQNASAGSSLNSCVDFVGNNPANFTNAYFEINSIRVYQMPENAVASSTYSTSLSTVTPSTSITVDVAMGSTTSVSSAAYIGPISSLCAGIISGNCTITATSTSTTTTSVAITLTSSRPSASSSSSRSSSSSAPVSTSASSTAGSASSTSSASISSTSSVASGGSQSASASISGTASSTSAVPASQTSLSCPASNGTTLSDTQGNQYILLCGIATDNDPSFNSSFVDGISTCAESCGNNTGCVNAEYIEGSGACYFKATYTTPMTGDGEDSIVLLSAYGAFSSSSSIVGTPTASGSSVASTGMTLSTSSISASSTATGQSASGSSSSGTAGAASSGSAITSVASTSSFSTVTYGYTYYTTDSAGSTVTSTGTATLASSASACPTTTAEACSSNGAPDACTDSNGATYAVQCGTVYNGTVLNPSSTSDKSKRRPIEPARLEKRQQVEDSYTDCEEACDANTQCEAFNYVGDECTLIANVTGTSYQPGAVGGTQIAPAPAAANSTTYSTSTSSSTIIPLPGLNATLTSGPAATGTGSSGNGTCSPQCPSSAGQTCSDSSGMTYTVGCGVSFAGGDLTSFTGSSFADCLPTCDATSACVGVEYDSSTMTCYLKSSFNGTQTTNSNFIYGTNIRAVAPVATVGTSATRTTTLSLSSGATITVVPTTTLTSTVPTGGTYTTSSTDTYYVYTATPSLSSSGTVPTTSPSVCLCYTCAVTPMVVDATYCSITAAITGSSPNTNTAIATTTPGNCRALSGTGYTTIFTTHTVTGCDAQPTCPASGYLIGNGATGSGASIVSTTNAMGSSVVYTQIPTSGGSSGPTGSGSATSGITSAPSSATVTQTLTISGSTRVVTGSTAEPTCPYSEGELYTDQYGQTYYVQCNEAYVAPQPSGISRRQEAAEDASTLDVTSADSLADCVAACDFYNMQTFYDITYCLGVTWYENSNTSNCFLKSEVNGTQYAANAHSAFLTVNRVAVGVGNSSTTTISGNGMNPGITATSAVVSTLVGGGSTIVSTLTTGSGGTGAGTGPGTGPGTGAGTGVSTAISISQVPSTVYGTSTAVSTIISGGTTVEFTYGVSTALSIVYSASTITQTTTTTVSVSVSRAVSTAVSVSISSVPGSGGGVVTVTTGGRGGSGYVTVTAAPVTVISYVQASSSSSSFTCRTYATNYLNGAHGRVRRDRKKRSIWDWDEGVAKVAEGPRPGDVPKPWVAANRGRL